MSHTETPPPADQTETPRFLRGNFAPVHEEVTAFDLVVEGAIPPELHGLLARTGPNPINPDPTNFHWFTGDGMVHGVALREGRAEWYRNRWVRSPMAVEALGGSPVPRPEGGLYDGLGNTNVFGHAGSLWAVTEGSLPYELSPELDTIRAWDFGGPMPAGMNAHPKIDPHTGDLHVLTYDFFQAQVRYIVVSAAGVLTRDVVVPLGGSSMVHETGLTASQVVILDLPVVLDLELAMAGGAMPFKWDAEYRARVGLLPRDGEADDTVWVDVDPCYAYHSLNAYDDGDNVVMDLVVYPRAFDNEVRDPFHGKPTMHRWTIDPIAGKVTDDLIDDRGQEFPRPDPRVVGEKHRYGWSLLANSMDALGGVNPDSFTGILKYDVNLGTVDQHDLGDGRVGSEFSFVPASDDAAEDEGWLLGYVYDKATDRSDVTILDAQDMSADPIATIHLPVRVPAGFHGNWVSAENQRFSAES